MKTIRSLLIALTSLGLPSPAAPVQPLPSDFQGALQPQISVAPSGRVHLVFGKDNSIFHTTSPDGLQFSAPTKVGSLEKLALKMRRGPRVTATDKLVLVTAISHADGNVHAWTSADTGATWAEGTPLNTATKSAAEGLHSVAGDGRGLVAAVWLDSRTKHSEPWGRVSHDGGVTWADEASIYQSPDGNICQCCAPTVAISPTGEIAALWRNWLGGSRDMYLATSRDGRTFSTAKKLGTGTWKLNGCPMDGGGLTFTPAGKWLTVWRRELTAFACEASGTEIQLAANATQPITAYAGKTPLILWEANGALMLKRGSESPSRFANNAAAASIVSGADTACIAWEATVNGAKTILFDRVR